MSATDLQGSVLAVLRRVVPVAPVDLDPEQPFRDQFEMDSLDFLNFVLRLEESLGVEIPEIDYPKLASLQGCLDYLAQRVR